MNLKIIKRKGKYFAYLKGNAYDLSFPPIVALNAPPYIKEMNAVIESALKHKKFEKEDINLYISEDHFFGNDCLAEQRDSFMSGWVYDLKGLVNEKIWVCSDILLLFEKPPLNFFLRLD